jgi:hypothetical protein
MWRTKLFQYSDLSADDRPLDLFYNFLQITDWASTDGIRVLSISMGQALDSTFNVARKDSVVSDLAADVRRLLDQNQSLLIVIASVVTACGHAWLVSLPQGPITGLRSPCQTSNWIDVPSDAAWDPTSPRFVLAESYADNTGVVNGSYRAFSVANDLPTQVGAPELEGWYWRSIPTGEYSGAAAEGHMTDADGVTATWWETGWWDGKITSGVYDCEPIIRLASPPFTLLFGASYLGTDPQYPGYCQPSIQPLRQPGGVAAHSPPSRHGTMVSSFKARRRQSVGGN